MKKRRVAITGLGVVSPLGHCVAQTWEQLLAGASGIDTISHFDASGFSTSIAAEVKQFDKADQLQAKHLRYASQFTKYAVIAAREAMRDADLHISPADIYQWGLVVGSGMMTTDFDYLTRFQRIAAPEGVVDWNLLYRERDDFLNVMDFATSNSNSALSILINEFGMKGYATSVHTACASGGQALGLAKRVIERGDATYMLAGGFDSMISPLGLSSFCLLGALSADNHTPTTASRPFDGLRNGFVLGEGAAFLILEEWESAQRRGARIYAELAGEGNSLSSYRITDSHPNGDGARQAIDRALADANISALEVDAINAHGTSTKMNDLSETNAIKAVFGDHAYKTPISATKSQTGHLIAAAGALEAVLSVLSIHHGIIPATMNHTTADPECDLDYVVEGHRKKSIGAVLSNSFGFGGSNSALLFKHPEFTR